MAKHRRVDSVQSATGTTVGDSEKTRGHLAFGLLVVAENLDTTNDTLSVVAKFSADDEHYAQAIRRQTEVDALEVTVDDFEESPSGSGTYAAFIPNHNLPAEYVRAEITEFTDAADSDLSVDASIFIGGWSGRGKAYNEREDTPTGQLGR